MVGLHCDDCRVASRPSLFALKLHTLSFHIFQYHQAIPYSPVVPNSVPTVETACFMPWNKVFQAMKQTVSSNETKCFKRWNKVFQALETF